MSNTGKFTNSDVDSIEDLATIDVEGANVLWVQFLCTVAALTAFTVEYRAHPAAPWFTIASAGSDYTSPGGPMLGASGDLTTAAASSSAVRWLKLNVQGVSAVRLRAAGTSSVVVGYYRKG